MSWTVSQMEAEGPCARYGTLAIEALWGVEESLTMLQILALDIPADHRLWVATLPGALTAPQTDAWIEDIFTRLITAYVLTCGVEAVEDWGQDWIDDVDRTKASALAAADLAGDLVMTCLVAKCSGCAADGSTENAITVVAGSKQAEQRQQIKELVDVLTP